MTIEDQKPEETHESLEHDAARLHREIEQLDAVIKQKNADRSEKKKELRSITQKLVTLQLKSKAA